MLEQQKKEDAKSAKAKVASKTGKRDTVQEELPKQESVFDPNSDKVIPNVIRLKRDLVKTTSSYIQVMSYLMTIKKDGESNLIIEDN